MDSIKMSTCRSPGECPDEASSRAGHFIGAGGVLRPQPAFCRIQRDLAAAAAQHQAIDSNPWSPEMRPVRDITRMVTTPFQAAFVVGLCFFINQMTNPERTWWHWVALGMGIATLVAIAKGLRTLLVLALAWWVGKALLARFGAPAKAAFDAWVAREQPGWSEVVRAWHRGGPASGANDYGVVRH
jgi:hypothetical protein